MEVGDHIVRRISIAVSSALLGAFGPTLVPAGWSAPIVAGSALVGGGALMWPWLKRVPLAWFSRNISWRFRRSPPGDLNTLEGLGSQLKIIGDGGRPSLLDLEHLVPLAPLQLPTIVGTAQIAEEDDTALSLASTSLTGLYVGNIIVAAGSLETEHRLEIAIMGYNGTDQKIVIGEIEGRIWAGTENIRDHVEMPPLAPRETARCDPGTEFRVVVYQQVFPGQVQRFLVAFERGMVSLDLRHLTIKAACENNISRWTRLPLWDGVVLRRRDDIVSNRNTIVSITESITTGTSVTAKVAKNVSITERVHLGAHADAEVVRGEKP